MASYTKINVPYHNYMDGSPVFVSDREGFSEDFGKLTAAKDRYRQDYFHSELDKLCHHYGSQVLPVFIQWSTGEQKRMDKGCIGHALAAGKIERVKCDQTGMVTHVEVKK